MKPQSRKYCLSFGSLSFVLAFFVGQTTLVQADERPDPPTGMAELFVNGCHFFVEEAFLKTHVRYAWTWAGNCNNTYANGKGTLRVYDESRKLVSEESGVMNKGKFQVVRQDQTANKPQANAGWDQWLETTGNKTKVAAPIPASQIRIIGSAPVPIETVLKACQHLVNITGPGKPGVGSIFAIEYLAPVEASTVYGNIGPQGRLAPVKLHANYRDGEKLYTPGYLQ